MDIRGMESIKLANEKQMEEIELINKATEELKRLRELTILQRMYIELLGNEIDSMFGIAHVHGWRSKRIEEGKLLREKIALLENNAPQEFNTNGR